MQPLAGGGPSIACVRRGCGPLAALGGQDVGVACVGVAPAQVVLQPVGQRGVIPVVRVAQDKGADGPELRLDRVGAGCTGGREAQPDPLNVRSQRTSQPFQP